MNNLNLEDLKKRHIQYDWKTIFVGIQEKYFNKGVISHYAVELMEIGDESEFVHELAWGVSSEDLDKVMLAIKTNYFPQLNEESTILIEENRKLRFVYLSKIKETCKDENELLSKIAEFYGNHNYPEDMITFVNYMPQELPTKHEDIMNRFEIFLKRERIRFS